MKLIIVPGFLGFANEPHHIDLAERARLLGIDSLVVASEELAKLDFEKYRLSKHIKIVNQVLDKFNNEEVGLVGVSLGGVVATIVSSGRANVVKLACVVSPYKFGVRDDMESRLSEWESKGLYSFTSSRYGMVDVPYEFVIDAQQYDAREDMPDIKCPKLFLAGSLDERVPSHLTLALSNAANDPKIFRLIDGMRHDYKNQPKYAKLVNDLVLDFVTS